MKLFIVKISIFVFSILLYGILFILFCPYDKSFAYHSMEQDGKQASWIYDRITNKVPIDIAIIGSSYTLNGINDSLIENFLESNGKPCYVANLALSWTGRNFHYVLTQDLLENKNPSLIIIEVQEWEAPLGHPAFPIIASGKDIIFQFNYLNFKVFHDFISAVQSRLNYIKNKFGLVRFPHNGKDTMKAYGWQPYFSKIALSEIENRKRIYDYDHRFMRSPIFSNILYSYNRTYLEALCKELKYRNIPFVFLYFPRYRSSGNSPVDLLLYKKNADIWIPPSKIFLASSNFANLTHLNEKGAEILSIWVADKINNRINNR